MHNEGAQFVIASNRLAPSDLQHSTALVSRLAPSAIWSDMGEADHFVQFYEDDAYLVESVGGFISTGLSADQCALVIGTDPHRQKFETVLRAEGVDLEAVKARKQYVAVDASEWLSKFVFDGLVDGPRLKDLVAETISKMPHEGRPIRVFGEMVALLWAAGNVAGAIRLEELWGELIKIHSLMVFCAYPMTGFRGEVHSHPLLRICSAHSRVIPAESYSSQPNADERLRIITQLQQKAASLEAEVAERKQVEAALREQQATLTMAVAVAQLGMWELDLNTHDFTCSAQCRAHFGILAGESTSLTRLFGRIHRDDRKLVELNLQVATTSIRDHRWEFRVVAANGEIRWVLALARFLQEKNGRLLGVTSDISERKTAQGMLERLVLERTKELQETLYELQSFSYSISHDMRSPLRSMRGYADLLLEHYKDSIDEEGRHYLERIATSAVRLDRLIQDVLTFNDVARAPCSSEAVNLQKLLVGILETYCQFNRPYAEVMVEGALPSVIGNEGALTQCLSNLLGNAVKFVAPGTLPRVRIWAQRIAKTPGSDSEGCSAWVRVYIEDNGIGIAEEFHEKIFQMLQRLSKDYEGTGIGLAIVKKSVDRMGGQVGLHSAPGQGSIFWLELPEARNSD